MKGGRLDRASLDFGRWRVALAVERSILSDRSPGTTESRIAARVCGAKDELVHDGLRKLAASHPAHYEGTAETTLAQLRADLPDAILLTPHNNLAALRTITVRV